MASDIPPVKGTAYTEYIWLLSQADTDLFQTSVTLAAGDVTVSKDGAAFNNIAALPTEIGTSGCLAVALSATEMNADVVIVRFRDAAGNEWCDAGIVIHTVGQTFDDGFGDCGCGDGAIEFTYTVTDAATGNPIPGVRIDISTDVGGTNVIWCGLTDTFGVARSASGCLPYLDAGTYYVWRHLAGWVFTDPDTEVVA